MSVRASDESSAGLRIRARTEWRASVSVRASDESSAGVRVRARTEWRASVSVRASDESSSGVRSRSHSHSDFVLCRLDLSNFLDELNKIKNIKGPIKNMTP